MAWSISERPRPVPSTERAPEANPSQAARRLGGGRLTARGMWRLVRFACVGLLGVVVNSTVLWLLTDAAHVYYLPSSVVATELAILCNFTLNHTWTFASLHDTDSIFTKLAKFNGVALGGLLLTVSSLFVLTRIFGLHYLIANLFAVGTAAVWNYTISRHWIWSAADPASPTRHPEDVR